ncbi:Protein kinase domain [Arabidopsis thaliana x Arabidopsis arenosa]|uniref:Protein kinase domain n=1 Tax=Arabidopsis thaliana x Arabidopsis arenosa TaxID=1240361 RepID=A0A8T1ZSL5_9BRAS|nr:Protein kinase domain [Arabidopsis thaliana x Arabidopsis arenosa]
MKGFFKTESETRKHSDKNGSLLHEELIASSDGKYNPIRMFSSDQILKATNNFDADHIIAKDRFIWYKGTIEERRVLIKKLEGDYVFFSSPENVYRDIAVLSMMSSHKNVLKLLGCCVEFYKPVLVCEFAEKGPLKLEDKDGTPLPWSARLKIGKDIANAVAYLHTAFPRVIINRDIKPQNIFLDEDGTAKLSSFCLSISIPEGESSVYDDKVVYGVSVDPEYNGTGLVSERFDVYSFGVTMLFLLGGELGLTWLSAIIGEFGFPFPACGEELADQFMYVIDSSIWNGESEASAVQVEAFYGLALRCIRFWPGQDVLTMLDVAKELKGIEDLFKASSSEQDKDQIDQVNYSV